MNVIISNKYRQELDKLEIDISKKLEGEFEVEEIIETFSDYFFNKMIIDITAIKKYERLEVLKNIPMNLNVEKIIFLLDEEKVDPDFLSELVSIGIYNFTTTTEEIMHLYNNPNSYINVVHYQDKSFEKKEETQQEEIKPEEIFNNYYETKETKQHIIGIKNMTKSAGATTLSYILKNELCNYKDTIAIEINKKDFLFLRDQELISVEEANLYNELSKHKDKDIIILDLNDCNNTTMCTDILYLIEPTKIKLNKMIMVDKKVFEKLIGKKIILNKSLLSKSDISSFESESNSKVYYNIPPLDEKKSNSEEMLPLLEKLGLLENKTSNDNKFLGIFNV